VRRKIVFTKALTVVSFMLALTVSSYAQDQGIIIGWGSNVDFDDSLVHYGQATPPDGNDFTAIDAGLHHSVALTSDGSITAWGADYYGQVGTTPLGTDFITIAAGHDHNVAIRTDGTLQAWGLNDKGQASPPPGNDFIAVAAGAMHSLALRSDGSLTAWGIDSGGVSEGNYGQVTDTPADSNFIAIASGKYFCLAIAADAGEMAGPIRAWGRNAYGESTPPPGDDFIAVAAGSSHSLALRSDGSIVAWGGSFFDYGQTEDPPGNDYVAIAAGEYHNVALKSDGSLYTWGKDNKGQVSGAPAGTNFIGVAAGGSHSLAVLDCPYQLQGDYNEDCRVNLADFRILASAWMSGYTISDLQSMTANWLTDCGQTPLDPACIPKE
jgi:alpha-tubulin suppressor-like RCC1 family protein